MYFTTSPASLAPDQLCKNPFRSVSVFFVPSVVKSEKRNTEFAEVHRETRLALRDPNDRAGRASQLNCRLGGRGACSRGSGAFGRSAWNPRSSFRLIRLCAQSPSRMNSAAPSTPAGQLHADVT